MQGSQLIKESEEGKLIKGHWKIHISVLEAWAEEVRVLRPWIMRYLSDHKTISLLPFKQKADFYWH